MARQLLDGAPDIDLDHGETQRSRLVGDHGREEVVAREQILERERVHWFGEGSPT